MAQQQDENRGGGWLAWLAAGVALALGAAAMALVMVAGILRTTITAPDFSMLSLCLHGAGWDGGLIPGDPGDPDEDAEEDPESDSEEESEESELGEDAEDESEDEEEPGEDGDGDEGDESGEDSSEEEESGEEEGPGWWPWPWPGEEDGDPEEVPSVPGPGEGDGGGGGEPWWPPEEELPENPEDWAFVLPRQEPAPTMVHTVSLSAAAPAAAPAVPASPSPEGLWVPEDMLELYEAAGEEWEMDRWILTSIGYHESRHGTDPNTLTENHAGALGPMQFVRSAWEHHGVYPDGRSGTPPLEDRLDPATAVWSAANKLTDQGIRTNTKEALHAYNRSWAYVDMIMRDAEKFRDGDFETRDGVGVGDIPAGGSGGSSGGGIPDGIGSGTEEDFDSCWELLSSIIDGQGSGSGAGGFVARAPDEVTQEVVDWALAQRGKPYIWGGTGPAGYDCSGLVMGAYASVGLSIPRVTHDQVKFGQTVRENDVQAGDLVFFEVNGACGVNCGLQPRHVGMVVDPDRKMMVEAWCTNCGPIDVRTWADGRRTVYAFTRPLADASAAPLIDKAGTD